MKQMIYVLLTFTTSLIYGQTYLVNSSTIANTSSDKLPLIDVQSITPIIDEPDIVGPICFFGGKPTKQSIESVTGSLPSTFEDADENTIESKSGPGPNTGLEGHNFTEAPAIIYPNPVKDVLQIKSTDPITVIEILNLHGEVEKVMDPKEEMNVSEFPAGIYYVRITFENKKAVQIEKILVIK